MNRISNEDGVNAGYRNLGRFFLSLIPWALGIGAMAWLGTFIAFHEWQREMRQSQRAAVYVGSPDPQKAKVKITVVKNGCITVNRVDLDGIRLVINASATSQCIGSGVPNYTEWKWQLVSPDGTVLASETENSCNLDAGAKMECRLEIGEDDRASELKISVSRGMW